MDETLAQVAFLESERNRSVVVDIKARLGQMLLEKEAILIELAKWKERSIGADRMLSTEVYT